MAAPVREHTQNPAIYSYGYGMYLSNDPATSSATAVLERPAVTEPVAVAETTPAPAAPAEPAERSSVVRHPAYRNLMWAR